MHLKKSEIEWENKDNSMVNYKGGVNNPPFLKSA